MDNDLFDEMFKSLVAERLNTRAGGISGSHHTISLSQAISEFEQNLIDFPPHQRDKSWSDIKYKEYVLTILGDTSPPGSFELYYLLGNRTGVKYLNDGSQRLRAAIWFKENHDAMGISEIDMKNVLANTFYQYTIKQYYDHQKALQRFQIVNSNVPLTEYQITIGDIIYCQGVQKEPDWSNLIKEVHGFMENSASRLNIQLPQKSHSSYLPSLHTLYRHDMSLLLRFLSKEKERLNYKPASKVKVKTALTEKKDIYFEVDLASLFSQLGIAQVERQLAEFKKLIKSSISIIENAWSRIEISSDERIQSTAFRWLLDVDVWRRNNRYATSAWTKFVEEFLAHTKGSSKLFYTDKFGDRRTTNVKLSDVASIEAVCGYIDSDFSKVVARQSRRNQSRS